MPPKKAKRTSTGTPISSLQKTIGPEEAKKLLGIRPAGKGENGVKIGEEKVVFENNKTNRPFSLGLAKQYAHMMLRGEWAGQSRSGSKTSNGEPILVGKNGIVSGAHRLAAVLLAEAERQHLVDIGAKDKLEAFGLGNKPVSFLAPIITGIDDASADTVDTGKSRKLDDILFRRNEFNKFEEGLSENALKQLSKALSHAIRLVWLRTNGHRVARGPKLHHPEAVEFLEKHPLLLDAVYYVWTEDGGSGSEGKRISSYLSLGYAAAMLYLFSFSQSDRAKLEEEGYSSPPELWEKATEFWTLFAQDLHSKENPIKALHKALEKNALSEDKLTRDALCTLCVRAWLAHIGAEKKWKTTKQLVSKLYTKDGDKQVLNFERLGGIDLDPDRLKEIGLIDEVPVRKETGGWKIGDTAWVDQPEVEPWFGTIQQIADDGQKLILLDQESGQEFLAHLEWLRTEKPEEEEEELDLLDENFKEL